MVHNALSECTTFMNSTESIIFSFVFLISLFLGALYYYQTNYGVLCMHFHQHKPVFHYLLAVVPASDPAIANTQDQEF